MNSAGAVAIIAPSLIAIPRFVSIAAAVFVMAIATLMTMATHTTPPATPGATIATFTDFNPRSPQSILSDAGRASVVGEGKEFEMTLDEAESAERAAKRALIAVEIERTEAANAARDAVYAEFGDRIKPLATALNDARSAVVDIKNATPDHEWEGRKVFRMESVGRSYQRLTPIRVEGIVETVRVGAQFANNLSRYSTPNIGDVIVRLLKKDGSPGLKFSGRVRDWKLVQEQGA